MGTVEIIEGLPLGQLLGEIDVVGIGQQLIELAIIGAVGPLDLAVQPRSPWFDVRVTNAAILDVPVKLGLELMTVVGADGVDPERELLHDVINEVDRVRLCVAGIDLQRPDSRSHRRSRCTGTA
jgi:hypothetical protein